MPLSPLGKELLSDVIDELPKIPIHGWKDLRINPPDPKEHPYVLIMYRSLAKDIVFDICDYHEFYKSWRGRNHSTGYICSGWWLPVEKFPMKIEKITGF